MNYKRTVISLFFALASVVLPTANLRPIAKAADVTLHVSINTGEDTPSCGSEGQPCKTLNYTVFNRSAAKDVVTIRVAAGTYLPTQNPCNRESVMCVQDRNVTLLGGYTPNNWQTANPSANLTVIDGQNRVTGVYLQGFVVDRVNPSIRFKMSGFTIQNGKVEGKSSGSETDVTAFGGGLFADFAYVELSDLIFRNNESRGGTTTQPAGGAGAGGGIALRGSGTVNNRSILQNIVFTGNRSRGGGGGVRGGIAFGGGIFVVDSAVLGKQLTFQENSAIAGDSAGQGVVDGEDAGSQGGAISVQIGSDAIFENITATNNLSQGGNAGFDGGGGGGGAILAELATLTVRDAVLDKNTAQGATGAEGGLGAGGALFAINTNVTLERVSMTNNKAIGGSGTSKSGAAGGGAAYIAHFREPYTLVMKNSVVARNHIQMGTGGTPPGGAGGGLWLQGVKATINHSTFSKNTVGPNLGGSAIIAFGVATNQATQVDASYNIFEGHTQDTAVTMIAPATFSLNKNLFANNANNVASGIVGAETSILAQNAGFVSADDYHLLKASSAINAATGSNETVDRDNSQRQATPDLGAYEYQAPLLPPLALKKGTANLNSITLGWELNPDLQNQVTHYVVVVVIEVNGTLRITREVRINVGNVTEYTLLTIPPNQQRSDEDLTPYAPYLIKVEAQNASNAVVASTEFAPFLTTDKFVYLPLAKR